MHLNQSFSGEITIKTQVSTTNREVPRQRNPSADASCMVLVCSPGWQKEPLENKQRKSRKIVMNGLLWLAPEAKNSGKLPEIW